jgi:branched-chain amino acid transport system permease protein
VPLIPGITAVQGAALREIFLSASLLVVLRFRVRGLLPEAHDHLVERPDALRVEPIIHAAPSR